MNETWFLLRWGVTGWLTGSATVFAIAWLWTMPVLLAVVLGACSVWAGWIFGDWWENRKDRK